VGNSTTVDYRHTHDRWNAGPPYATFGVSAHSSFGLQHGPSVDGRGLDAKVKQFNFSDLFLF
jgi:hypothetical protein